MRSSQPWESSIYKEDSQSYDVKCCETTNGNGLKIYCQTVEELLA